jgi:uncharacterized membrane protein YedE/YeeE
MHASSFASAPRCARVTAAAEQTVVDDGIELTGPTPAPRHAAAALLGGAALLGVSWGISGYCPGPSVVALGSGALSVVVFLAATAAGMALSRALTTRHAAPEAGTPPATVR